jgi:hypothetical protein
MEHLVSLGIDPKRFRLSVAAENEPAGGGAEVPQRGLNSRVELSLLNEVVEEAGRDNNRRVSGKDGQTNRPPASE